MGRDAGMAPGVHKASHVSIHAPAWGATLFAAGLSCSSFCFNPRARMGRDLAHCDNSQKSNPFQSTRPHGARLIVRLLAPAVPFRFNPRARMGRDHL